MAMVASTNNTKENFDTNRCIRMALVHDLAEATVGDITPYCGVTDEDKHAQELAAMQELTAKLSGIGLSPLSSTNDDTTSNSNVVGEDILSLWKEYEAGETAEAKLVKDIDKLEMILQALEYEQDGKNGKSLDGFFDGTRGKWRTPIGEAWGNEIESRRTRQQTTAKDESK